MRILFRVEDRRSTSHKRRRGRSPRPHYTYKNILVFKAGIGREPDGTAVPMFVIIDFAGSYEPLHQLLLTLFWFIAHECS